jgi:hypothetical protein
VATLTRVLVLLPRAIPPRAASTCSECLMGILFDFHVPGSTEFLNKFLVRLSRQIGNNLANFDAVFGTIYLLIGYRSLKCEIQ